MKLYLTLSFLLVCLFSFSQGKESFYIFNGNWKVTLLDSAKYLYNPSFFG